MALLTGTKAAEQWLKDNNWPVIDHNIDCVLNKKPESLMSWDSVHDSLLDMQEQQQDQILDFL